MGSRLQSAVKKALVYLVLYPLSRRGAILSLCHDPLHRVPRPLNCEAVTSSDPDVGGR